MKTAIILAGGKGTRIKKLFPGIPKPLIPINGIPFIERAIKQMKIYGFERFIITIGYMADKIIAYLGDGSRLGVKIEYFIEDIPLGSGGALPIVARKYHLMGTVAVVSGDLVFDIDWNRFLRWHMLRRADISLLVHPTLHPHDSDIVDLHHGWVVMDGKWQYLWEQKHRIRKIYRKGQRREKYIGNISNAGIMLIEAELLKLWKGGVPMNLEHDIVIPLIEKGYRVYGYLSPEYVKDAGTPERYSGVEKDIQRGIVPYWNFAYSKPAVFWDRDGTINKYKGFIKNPEEIELMESIADKIKDFRERGYLNILVTNQAHISFGWITFDRLQQIHNYLMELLAESGTYLDGIYYCPTHPDNGYDGEKPELKGHFMCRKPLPGMLYEASDDFNIDIRNSLMIGDTDIDRQTALNARIQWLHVNDLLGLA